MLFDYNKIRATVDKAVAEIAEAIANEIKATGKTPTVEELYAEVDGFNPSYMVEAKLLEIFNLVDENNDEE